LDLLIIDDEESLHIQLKRSLMKLEFKISSATTVEEARRFLSENTYRCILANSMVRGQNGVDFVAEVAKNFPDSKRLLMSDRKMAYDAEKAVNLGRVEKIYRKPILLDELVADLLMLINESTLTANIAEDLTGYLPKVWHISEKDSEATEKTDEEYIQGEGKLILIVDDNRDMRNFIAGILKKRSFRYIMAKDGIEGLRKAEQYKPDLIVADWMMPELTGLEMIERLHMEPVLSSIPTILLTAKSDEASKLTGMQKGANAYIGKPFDELELFSILENLLRLKAGEERIRELNRDMTENILKRFLPSRLVDEIASGKKVLDDTPKLMNITILFANIVSFTKRSEELGAKKTSALLNSYFDKMTEVVLDNGGTVDKFLGDGIMAIFGAPEQDSPEVQIKKALDAASAMKAALDELNKEWEKSGVEKILMRVGIHHGGGIVGTFGGKRRTEYTVIGPAVNLASRIEKAAEPGEIFFSMSVRDLISNRKWKKAGVYNLRGIGEVILFKLEDSREESAA
ncbi:MAG: response regulator, partial [Oligoflexales bacterium]|nr:response regulator [Oligoflexales bacterium]